MDYPEALLRGKQRLLEALRGERNNQTGDRHVPDGRDPDRGDGCIYVLREHHLTQARLAGPKRSCTHGDVAKFASAWTPRGGQDLDEVADRGQPVACTEPSTHTGLICTVHARRNLARECYLKPRRYRPVGASWKGRCRASLQLLSPACQQLLRIFILGQRVPAVQRAWLLWRMLTGLAGSISARLEAKIS